MQHMWANLPNINQYDKSYLRFSAIFRNMDQRAWASKDVSQCCDFIKLFVAFVKCNMQFSLC